MTDHNFKLTTIRYLLLPALVRYESKIKLTSFPTYHKQNISFNQSKTKHLFLTNRKQTISFLINHKQNTSFSTQSITKYISF